MFHDLAIIEFNSPQRTRTGKRDNAFEEWLLHCALTCSPELSGSVSAMARAVFDEWSLAHSMNEFKTWLDQGPPSDNADEGKRKHHNPDQGERQ